MSQPIGYSERRAPGYRSVAGLVNGRAFKSRDQVSNDLVFMGRRNPPVHGDRKGDFPYARNGRSLDTDIPRSVRYFRDDKDGRILDDYVVFSSLLRNDPILTYDPRYPPDVYIENARAASIVGALNDLAANKMQLGNDIAEGRQVVDMFADNVSQLARSVIAAKKGNFSAIPKILGMNKKDVITGKFAANKWLEYSYGWKPLMGTIHDLQPKIHDIILKDTILRGSKRASETNSYSWNDGRNAVEAKVSVSTTIKARIVNPALHAIDSWGLLNPLSIAWEVTPFSFVTDWFMPVGNTLNALTAGCGLAFASGSTMTKRTYTYTVHGSDYRNRNEQVLSPGLAIAKGYDVQRDIWHEMPATRFYADTTPFSTPRVANAAALLRQLV